MDRLIDKKADKPAFCAGTAVALVAVLWLGVCGCGGCKPEDVAREAEETTTETLQEPAERTREPGEEYHIDGRIVRVCVENREKNVLSAAGSGVVYAVLGEELWIATAGHVLEHAGDHTVRVDFGDEDGREAWVTCEMFRRSESVDVAFLRLPLDELPDGICEKLILPVTDKERYDAMHRQDVVCVWGYEEKLITFEGILEEFWIYVEDFAQDMMVADCEIAPGMSGGGLYDGDGDLIGIACGGNEAGELVAVPLHVVQAEFEDLVLQHAVS